MIDNGSDKLILEATVRYLIDQSLADKAQRSRTKDPTHDFHHGQVEFCYIDITSKHLNKASRWSIQIN